MIRWRVVKPATSRTALASPMTSIAATATPASGTTPMTEIGRPQTDQREQEHEGQPMPAHEQDRPDRPDDAAQADRRVEQADARVAEAEQLDRRDDDEDGQCAAHQRLDADDRHHEQDGRHPSQRAESGQDPDEPAAARPAALAASLGAVRSRRSGRIWVTATVASAIPTAPATATTGVPKARRIPAKAGPTSTPMP